ncbi:MAG: hypothetical protein KDD64_01075 [Bdellovibrionales bacterium]|nr:hypothetical protein [Bdellovibrionales bacterium]
MEKQVIIFANGAEKGRVEEIANLSPMSSVLIVDDSNRGFSLPEGAQTTNSQDFFGTRIAELESTRCAAIVIDAAWDIEIASLGPVLEEASRSDENTVTIFPLSHGEEIQFSQDLTIDTAINLCHPQQAWPVGTAAICSSTFESIKEPENCSQFIGQAILAALSIGCSLRLGANTLVLKKSSEWKGTLSQRDLSALLKYAVGTLNIEELFPNHSWQTHQEESAAACYHTLAAMFLKFNDLEAAKECLSFGDQLEDSPRSLALKGLIALTEGETLTAVANMVSSLQEYEKRKKSTSQHYLAFQPRDLEQINTSLQSGLSALNERDNDLAMKHFTSAVFNFDQFYLDIGLSQ